MAKTDRFGRRFFETSNLENPSYRAELRPQKREEVEEGGERLSGDPWKDLKWSDCKRKTVDMEILRLESSTV